MKIIYLEHYKENRELGLDAIPELSVKDIDDAGIDLRAAITEPVVLAPGDDIVINSGVKMHIGSHPIHNYSPYAGIYGAIVPRSGLGFKHYVRLANTMGIIDSNYLGEILIKIRNEGQDNLTINRGDRICQLIFHVYVKGVTFDVVDEFDIETERGEGGIGHSGVH